MLFQVGDRNRGTGSRGSNQDRKSNQKRQKNFRGKRLLPPDVFVFYLEPGISPRVSSRMCCLVSFSLNFSTLWKMPSP